MLLSALLVTGARLEAGALDLPIGSSWGDPPGKLIDWGTEKKAEVAIILPPEKPDWRYVKVRTDDARVLDAGFVTEVEGRYFQGQLVEIALTQRDPKLTSTVVKARFLKEKRLYARRYGTFKVNRRTSANQNNFSTNSLSYHVEPLPGLFLLLTHTEMEDQLRQVREGRFSVIFRNENLLKELQKPKPQLNP